MKPYKPTLYEQAVYDVLYGLRDQIGTPARDLPLVFANQDLAEMDPPYALITVNPMRRQGADTVLGTGLDDVTTYSGIRTGTADVLVIGDYSADYASNLIDAMQRSKAAQVYHDNGMVFYGGEIMQDGSIRTDRQIVRATQLELGIRCNVKHKENIETIETLLLHYDIQSGENHDKGIMVTGVASSKTMGQKTDMQISIRANGDTLRVGNTAYPTPIVTVTPNQNVMAITFDSSDEPLLEIITTRGTQFMRCHRPGRALVTATVHDTNGGKHRIGIELQII